jgi:hypothetical protein
MSTLRCWTELALRSLAALMLVATPAAAQLTRGPLPESVLPAFDKSLWTGPVRITWYAEWLYAVDHMWWSQLARTEVGVDAVTGEPAVRAWAHHEAYQWTDAFGTEYRTSLSGGRFEGLFLTIGAGVYHWDDLDPAERAGFFLVDPTFWGYHTYASYCIDEAPPSDYYQCGDSEPFALPYRTAVTPEPATVALTATGLLALAGVARRRRA